jgi:hypothetical protein
LSPWNNQITPAKSDHEKKNYISNMENMQCCPQLAPIINKLFMNHKCPRIYEANSKVIINVKLQGQGQEVKTMVAKEGLYESPITNRSRDMANVKFLQINRLTDGRTGQKQWRPIFRCGGIKKENNSKNYFKKDN